MLPAPTRFLPVFFALLCSHPLAATPPWETAPKLKDLARNVSIESLLNPTSAQPDTGVYPVGPAMVVSNLKMRTTLWGTPDRVTISLTKNDVWDRRYNPVAAPTLAEIEQGAFSPANAGFVNPKEKITSRPHSLGYLKVEGGAHDPHRQPFKYPFPTMKPVGQIILALDDFQAAPAPLLRQSCASGIVDLALQNGSARADLSYVLGMTSNLYAIRARVSRLSTPPRLRLFRHQDTAHRVYMTPDGTRYTQPSAEAGRAWNGPVAAPRSGQDGEFFWITQTLPAEKTFPEGFHYVLMAACKGPLRPALSNLEGEKNLGTPAPDPWIRESTGVAATAHWPELREGELEILVTVVTSAESSDPFAEAQRRLRAALPAGFEGVARENTAWFDAFYDLRETGRIFPGPGAGSHEEIVRETYRSWYCIHGGGTKPDMRRLEASAHYAVPETDRQPWNGLPCYNEVFYTSDYVHNRPDRPDMWKQLLAHWAPGGRENARSMFGLPGMYLPHGYQPPVKPDEYVHNAIALELSLGTMAGLVRPLWDEWDYGGDINFLRGTAYPFLRDTCLFYEAYVTLEEDGLYHIVPSMQEESWGIYPRFARNKDVISALCMFRWAFERAAQAADLLGVDQDKGARWREIAAKLPPNPTWPKPGGPILAGMPGVEPFRGKDEHPWDAALYPALTADEITLDSSDADRDLVARTALLWPNAATLPALVLVGRLDHLPSEPGAAKEPWRLATHETVETLLNSRGDRIHLFPSIPDSVEIAFRHFQARGAFLVSAARRPGGVYFVEIEARRDLPCRLANPWPGKSVSVYRPDGQEPPVLFVESARDTLEFPAHAGVRYRLKPVP